MDKSETSSLRRAQMHAKKEDLPVVAEMPGLFDSRQARWAV
ncbi:MAG: hypothetical protein ABR507_04535 [Actinomycetota bacterium]